MTGRPAIAVVIPAYNESGSIGAVVLGVKPHAEHVIVVDDASTDTTSAAASGAGAKVIRHLVNRDQGAALQTGDEYALSRGADVIVHFDADGQHQADEIPDVIAPILDGTADVVFGSRFLGRGTNMPWFKRHVIFPVARSINRIFLGISLTDPQSGFRALSRPAALSLTIEQDGKAHCSEILSKLTRAGWRIKEVPVTVVYREFGLSLGGGWRIVKDLLIGKLLD